MELGWPLPKRRQYLKELAEQADNSKTHPVPFQERQQYLPVRVVPLGLPLYRLENGRTTGLQQEHIAAHPGLQADFFRADDELEVAQKVQHSILAKLARGSKNLFKEFEKKPQTEPIILSSSGYVINGNRRLSTWRSLYETDPKKYKHFSNIEVVILPHADEKDLDKLEALLQLTEDLKADYSWTSTALMLKEKMEKFKYSEDEIAAVYGMQKKDLRELFDCLDYGEQYLDIRNISKKFSELDDKEYAFRQICRTRPKLKESEVDKEIFERAAFCLADEAGEGKRIYAEIPKIADHIEAIRESLLAELEVQSDNESAEDVSIKLVEALEDDKNFEKARVTIRDTIEAETAKKKNQKKQDYVSSQIIKARICLSDALNAADSKSSKDGVADALTEIEELTKKLREWATRNGK